MEPSQLPQYLPVLMLGVLAIVFSFGMLFFSVLVGKKGRRPAIKDTAYECGMLPIGEGSTRLSVKFYLVAMLFLIFDIEVVFLYPWAIYFRNLGVSGLVEMGLFLGMLSIGLIYVWKKGALEWD